MTTLYVVPARGLPFEYRLDGEAHTVGRSSKADLVIADRSLSRQHARLFLEDENWLVEDLGSRNGTLVNREVISESVSLGDGDVIGLGASTATVRQSGAAIDDDGARETFGEHTVFRPAAELLESSSHSGTSPIKIGDADADVLKRYTERLQMLNEVHQAVSSSVALDELLDLILDRAFDQLGPEEGAVFLRSPDGTYECAANRSAKGPDHYCLYSRHLISEVAEKGLAALVLDAQMDDRFNEAHSILNAGVRSLVAAPLLDPDGPLGMMVLGSTYSVKQFGEEDMELLTSLASVAAMRIRNVRLTEEAVERKRLDAEVALARRIQLGLMPDTLPEVAGYQLFGGNLPSRGASGDFFKVEERNDGAECVMFLADVSGKGIGAAIITASLEALATGPIEQRVPPDEACERVSRRLFERTTPEKYATAFLAVLEPASGRVEFTNAGHNPGLVVRADGSSEWLHSTGPPLGILEEGTYDSAETTLGIGDTMILYTDGMTEAENPDEEEFGEERLEVVCVEHRDKSVQEIADALHDNLEQFAGGIPFADDRTMVLVKREG